MRNLRSIIISLMAAAAPSAASAQAYTGLSGNIHTPSAEMNEEGTARIGAHYLNKHFTPEKAFRYKGEKYNTADFYLSVTPFSWVEIAYSFTLLKTLAKGHDEPAYNNKDRYFSVKLRPLKEGKYWPAIAIGANDPFGSRGANGGSQYFCNFYVAATKHFTPADHNIGITLAYRKWKHEYNKKWQGVVGALTYRPSFAPDLRAIVEYDGDAMNVGADYLLFRHFFLQASLQRGKYFSGGACYTVNLF